MTTTPSDSEKLEPCPFSGHIDSTDNPTQDSAIAVTRFKSPAGGFAWHVVCCCGGTGKAARERSEAITAWNTRAPDSDRQQSGVGGALRQAADALVNGFAWSAVRADCDEAHLNLSNLIDNVRVSLSAAGPIGGDLDAEGLY